VPLSRIWPWCRWEETISTSGCSQRSIPSASTATPGGGSIFPSCTACCQNWLIAQEERIFDDYFLKRLSVAEADQIVASARWPEEFRTYERVLTVGHALSNPCRFFDPLDASLVWTVHDLRKERPAMTSEEIAQLIGSTSADVELMLATNAP